MYGKESCGAIEKRGKMKNLILWLMIYLLLLPVGLALTVGMYTFLALPAIGWAELRLLKALKKRTHRRTSPIRSQMK